MLYFLLILAVIVLGILLVIIINLLKHNRPSGTEAPIAALAERLNILSEQNRDLHHLLDSKLKETNDISREQFTHTANMMNHISRESSQTIAAVTEKLTKLDETNKQIVNFSGQLQSLQDILKNPKQRGILGEYFLEEILKNVLPPGTFQMQYKFKNGDIVDAVVFTKDKIIPVDSKFSLENYEKLINSQDDETREKYEKLFKQDLKNRIDETSKYIKPGENTLDFAFMFIPSETIYYDLLVGRVGLNSRSLLEYSFVDKKVIIVSPTSFLAYLQTVLQGLKAMQIEEGAKEIRSNVEKLARHLTAYEDFIKKLGQSMQTSVNHYNNAYKEFKKVDKDVAKITDAETAVEPLLIDKPNLD